MARPGNICTYVEENLDTFSERALCAPNSLVLSWYANFRLEALGPQVVGWGAGEEGAPAAAPGRYAPVATASMTAWATRRPSVAALMMPPA